MTKSPPKNPKDTRAVRLAEQLRANLQRRKAQSRARREGAADERPEGIAAAAPDTAQDKRDD